MTIEEMKMKGLLGWALEQSAVPGGLILYFLCFALAGIAGYLLGSINSSLLISRIVYKDDIRKHGSGNAGATNMMRTYGKKAAALTFLGDGAKGALAVLFGFLCCGTNSAYFAALMCTVGHAYPIFFGFRGGKGVVVTAVTLLCLNPLLFLLLLLLFVTIVATTKYISLGSIMGMMFYPLLLSSLGQVLNGGSKGSFPVLIAFLNAALVIWLHRENIKRLMAGTENKFSFKKSVKRPDSTTTGTSSPEKQPEPQTEPIAGTCDEEASDDSAQKTTAKAEKKKSRK